MENLNPPENHHHDCSFSKPDNYKRGKLVGELTEEGDIYGEKRRRCAVVQKAVMEVNHLDVPFISSATASPVHSLRLHPLRRYSVGRSPRHSDLLLSDRRVSRCHCHIFFNPLDRKIFIQEPRVSRSPLNGVFVNGFRIRRRANLSAGDEVSLVCANWNCCTSPVRVGFFVKSVVFEEKIVFQPRLDSQSLSQGSMSSRRGHKKVFAARVDEKCEFLFPDFEGEDVVARAHRLLTQCRDIFGDNNRPATSIFPVPVVGANVDSLCGPNGVEVLVGNDDDNILEAERSSVFVHVDKDSPQGGGVCEPPGKKFCLNRLGFMDDSSSSHHTDVSLQELLYPVESVSQMFIATFTSDISWFLSSCKIPRNLPVTLACHSTERGWDSSPEKRSSVPYSDFPNLVVVYPIFPEDIAFGKDLKRQGIGCHHPKLLVLQRDDFLRVIVTSANLVPSQWNAVTNTVWWQDFPLRSSPDFIPLFTQIRGLDINQEPKSDFCSQLAGFMASLLTDVPSQAHWIVELSKYDFGQATAHLVASVPGIHSYRAPNIFPSRHFLQCASSPSGVKFLGSVESSVVGLSYLFHKAADSNGALLRKLASFMEKSSESADGFLSVLLQRNRNIPADDNAVSILVPSPKELPLEDSVQLGFLPRKVSKWVSPLWDIGFFSFSAYVCRKDALAAAIGGSAKKATLSIHVSQGPNFENITKMMQSEHVAAISSMIAVIQRCTGLWRLQEVLAQYKWPEELESDFTYSASSIGAINARFLAAFSAAAGKTSSQFDSDESDPEWGCWSASQEMKNPSMRILFPTINRVQSAHNGILPSKRILCFSEKTWERVRKVDILHDAIPHPNSRVGHPMHIKVARRRFKSKISESSLGWVYCGSHNFSAAAWGRPISDSSATNTDDGRKPGSSSDQRLHVCNYELGIVFTFPPTEANSNASKTSMDLDSVVLPYVVPAPKYGARDWPATARAMREALDALNEVEQQSLVEVEEIPDEDETAEEASFVVEEKEEEKAYAKMLWSQISSS